MPFEWNTKTIAGIIIAALMVLSVLGFSIGSGQGTGTVKHKYNGYTFQQTPQGYIVKLPEGRVAFRFLPDQVSAYELPAEAVQGLRKATVVSFTFDPTNETQDFAGAMAYAGYELGQKLSQRMIVQQGLVNATGYEVPVITCGQASDAGPVVLFSRANQTGFRWEGFCLIAEAEDEDGVLRLADRIAYAVLGIME